jgi:hypothetical protein
MFEQEDEDRTTQVIDSNSAAMLYPKFSPTTSSTTTSCGEAKIATTDAELLELCRAAGRRSSGRMRAIHIKTNPENHGSAYSQICARRTSVECGREGKVVRKIHRVQQANQDGLFVPCAPHN